jgi:RNA polymerase sigma-70 factor (ECF subfamily)
LITPEIIQQCVLKDQHAFKVLYDKCIPYVYSVVSDHIKNSDFRQDLIQEIFAKVFLNISSYQEQKGEFKFWIRKIAVNQCLMFIRDKRKLYDYEDVETNTTALNISEHMDLSHLDPQVSQQVLGKMPTRYRQVFAMVVLENYTHQEVSQKLGISPATSRSQLTRSKQWLRQFFSENKTLIHHGFFN